MISGFSPVALMQLQDALGGGGSSTTVVIDFDQLAAEMQRLVRVAERIADTAENPTFAAGDEMCRRAATALEHGWYEDAVTDARRSVEAYPYRGAPHLLEGVALLHLGRTVEAFESLKSCIRYGEAAEPQHAATGALLAANLAYGAGKPEQARELLTAGFTATGHRCPALLVALINDHVVAHDPAVAAAMLRDDPRAWVGVNVPDDFFGEEGQRIAVAFTRLVEELRALVSAAEQFGREVSKWSPGDFKFHEKMFDSGSARYTTPDGYRFYADGGSAAMLRRYTDSLEPIDREHLPMRMLVGFDIVRAVGFRGDSYRPMPQHIREWYIDTADLRNNGRPIASDDTCLDVLVGEWTREFDWNIRRTDQPRGVGRALGTGIYLRTLRSRTYYLRDREEVQRQRGFLHGRQAPRGFRVKQWELDQYNQQQQTLPAIEAYLSLTPPDASALQQSILRWLEVTRPSGQPVVVPFAALDLPTSAHGING